MRYFAILACVVVSVYAQPRQFDVASLRKVDGACPPGQILRLTPGRVVFPCFTARQLIRTAYRPLTDYDHESISAIGGPAWMDSVHYAIEARAAGATITELTGAMLLGLLNTRFHLETHREPRNTPVYLLTVGAGGPKLKPGDSSKCVVRDPSIFPLPPVPAGGPVEFCGRTGSHTKDGTIFLGSYSVPLEGFATVLSSLIGRPISDRTGLAGKYDIHLEFARDSLASGPRMLNGEPAPSTDPGDLAGVSVFTAVQKQLGLKLTAGTAPVDVIVVDRIDQPGEN